ncbi:MAG: diiron oxygenase [Bryobacteraceae bacterium]
MGSITLAPPIDRTCLFLPEHLTHLYYAPVYRRLTAAQRLRYNQLFACYFNEQTIFFETRLVRYLARFAPTLAGDERRHAAMYQALNERAEPDLYRRRTFYFISTPPAASAALDAATRLPRLFPLFAWLILLQEERALFYAREIVARRDRLEPQFVEVNRRHMEDEEHHVTAGLALIDEVWEDTPALVRRLNARLFAWLVGEFFNAPKRAGIAVARRLAEEFADLDLPLLAAELRSLSASRAFHEAQYSRRIVPRTFARLDRCPEFDGLGRVLWGYAR